MFMGIGMGQRAMASLLKCVKYCIATTQTIVKFSIAEFKLVFICV